MTLLGENLRTAREKKGLSQRELARKCNIAFNMIYRYENGLTDPSVTTLQTIARELDVSLDYLAGLTQNPQGQIGNIDLTLDEQEVVSTLRQDGWPGVIRLGVERISK